jgi:hypothetical protein
MCYETTSLAPLRPLQNTCKAQGEENDLLHRDVKAKACGPSTFLGRWDNCFLIFIKNNAGAGAQW